MPKVKFPSGLCLAQIPAIMMQLGQEFGLTPSDWTHECTAMQLALDAVQFSADLNSADLKKRNWETRWPERKEWKKKWLQYLEATLNKAGTGYLAGSNLSYADFAILCPIVSMGGKRVLKQYDSLTTWFDMMKQLPAV